MHGLPPYTILIFDGLQLPGISHSEVEDERMKVLVLNSGSSSVKFQLFDVDGQGKVLAKGMAERIGLPQPMITCLCPRRPDNTCDAVAREAAIPDHAAAIDLICRCMLSEECGAIKSLSELVGIGHRVVHGGERFTGSVVINDDVLRHIEACSRLAPLHNPPALLGIRACSRIFKDTPQVAVFDTAFHHTIPPKAFMYAIPKTLYTKHGIRKYGFHGTSHSYVALEAARILGRDIKELKIITCHLGNGCSITAIQDGKVVDTSMGVTPLAGVMMGTRPGDIDPYIPLFMMKELGMTPDEVDKTLNKQSGLMGICNLTDIRDITAQAAQGNEDCALALDMFAYRVASYIGAYAMVMNGVDVIVFTGGIGENGADMRRRILRTAGHLGVAIDENKNRACDVNISAADATVATLVIRTNEELVIARETVRLVGKTT